MCCQYIFTFEFEPANFWQRTKRNLKDKEVKERNMHNFNGTPTAAEARCTSSSITFSAFEFAHLWHGTNICDMEQIDIRKYLKSIGVHDFIEASEWIVTLLCSWTSVCRVCVSMCKLDRLWDSGQRYYFDISNHYSVTVCSNDTWAVFLSSLKHLAFLSTVALCNGIKKKMEFH